MANTTTELLDQVVARVRQLPEDRQRAALDALREIADEPYQLSLDELRVLRSALADARSDRRLSDVDSDELLNEPWSDGATASAGTSRPQGNPRLSARSCR